MPLNKDPGETGVKCIKQYERPIIKSGDSNELLN